MRQWARTTGLWMGVVSFVMAVGGCQPIHTMPDYLKVEGVLRGEVTYFERIALPKGAMLEVELRESTRRPGATHRVIATTWMTSIGQVPIEFELPYQTADIRAESSYKIFARILVDGQPWFETTQAFDAITQGRPRDIRLRLVHVKQDAPTEASASQDDMP